MITMGRPYGSLSSSFSTYRELPDLIIPEHYDCLSYELLFIIFGKIIEIYESHPPQGLSEARRGKEIERVLLIRRGGVPPGAAALLLTLLPKGK